MQGTSSLRVICSTYEKNEFNIPLTFSPFFRLKRVKQKKKLNLVSDQQTRQGRSSPNATPFWSGHTNITLQGSSPSSHPLRTSDSLKLGTFLLSITFSKFLNCHSKSLFPKLTILEFQKQSRKNQHKFYHTHVLKADVKYLSFHV